MKGSGLWTAQGIMGNYSDDNNASICFWPFRLHHEVARRTGPWSRPDGAHEMSCALFELFVKLQSDVFIYVQLHFIKKVYFNEIHINIFFISPALKMPSFMPVEPTETSQFQTNATVAGQQLSNSCPPGRN
ncbi:hypothetical protein EVAR_82065_1 [Eumeta japonica]|uniref:Uncharacterized protein n=1 Tax=Eumeta variegata TaxID=151549 RepID=A0A4C1U1K8_EUMVA|nr:hypothetical protein EVAR_82065_1 [Eumeta japonica]